MSVSVSASTFWVTSAPKSSGVRCRTSRPRRPGASSAGAGADASAPPADAVAGNIVARLNGEMRGVLERELLELLNEGTLDELQALAGIGPKRAQYIHERRAARGPFARIDELAGVGGLTAAQAAQLASKNMERLLAAAR